MTGRLELPRPAIMTALVAACAAAVFLPAITGPWIYDDRLLIADNPYVHSLHWWPRWFLTDFWNIGDDTVRFGSRMIYWRPLISGSYALDWQLGGGSAVMFHVTNTLAHAAVGALAFVVLRRWIGALLPAFLVALLFAVHPTKAESVAWIAGRTDIYCMIAMLLASEGIARRLSRKRGGLILEVLATLGAYMTKEQAIVLPIFAAVEAWLALGRPALDARTLLRMARVAAPQGLIAVAYLGARSTLLPIKSGESGMPLLDHAQAVAESMGRFVELTVAPHALSVQQGLVRTSDGVPVHSTIHVVLGACALVGLCALAVLARRRAPALSVAVGVFLATLAPTLNIVYTNMLTLISERFLYLPMMGVAFGVGYALNHWPGRRVPLACVGAFIAFCSVQTLRRSSDFRDEDAFWSRELELHPESAEARRGLVRKLIRERRYEAALAQTLELTRSATNYQDVQVALEMTQLLSDLTPDRDRQTLEALDAFCRELLEPSGPVASLKTPRAGFTIQTTNKAFEHFQKQYELRIVMLRSQLRSRIGDDTSAIELAKRGLAGCAVCANVAEPSALVLARAGLYESAYDVLDGVAGRVSETSLALIRAMIDKAAAARTSAAGSSGPAALQARASELAALELWGRAYDVLEPYKDEIKTAPRFALGFAELAFRAGYSDVAREVLAVSMPAPQIDAQLTEWSARMGWIN